MLSPRILRPDIVTLFNKRPEEVSQAAVYSSVVLPNVKIVYAVENNTSQSINDLKVVDDITVIIDLTDAPVGYADHEKWDTDLNGWTLHTNGDYFRHKERKLAIIGFTLKPQINNKPGFIEVKCKRV